MATRLRVAAPIFGVLVAVGLSIAPAAYGDSGLGTGTTAITGDGQRVITIPGTTALDLFRTPEVYDPQAPRQRLDRRDILRSDQLQRSLFSSDVVRTRPRPDRTDQPLHHSDPQAIYPRHGDGGAFVVEREHFDRDLFEDGGYQGNGYTVLPNGAIVVR